MSAYVQDRAHVLSIIRTALEGPADPREIRPDNVWHGPRWSAIPTFLLADIHWSEHGKVWRRLDWLNAEEVAGMLYDENVASVRHRYAEDDEMIPAVAAFTMSDIKRARRLTATDALCALSGYEYQSCEHPEWSSSESLRVVEALRRCLCDFLARDSDCWSIPDAVMAAR